jgi:hypothetical protein
MSVSAKEAMAAHDVSDISEGMKSNVKKASRMSHTHQLSVKKIIRNLQNLKVKTLKPGKVVLAVTTCAFLVKM